MSFQTRRLSGEQFPAKPVAPSAVPKTPSPAPDGSASLDAHPRSRLFRIAGVTVISTLLGLLVLGGTAKALFALKVLTPGKILGAVGTDLPVDKDGFTNFLLLGSGDKSHDGVDLTDTMMVVSVDPKMTKSVVMLSLPRDLYAVQTAKMGDGRINELYRNYKGYLRYRGELPTAEASQGAMRELADELGRKLGVQIHHVVKVDFIAFVKAVDALGGIDIDVPRDLVDTQYPGSGYSYETFSVSAGLQHMDGETALKYARSRHSTSDFDRSARQQQIIQALGEKARSAGVATSPGKISALLKILSENVETTMTFGEILGGGKLAEAIDRKNVISMSLNNSTGYGVSVWPEAGGFLYNPPRDFFGGASVLLPVTLKDPVGSWRPLRALWLLLTHARAVELARPQITILNAGAKTGLARLLGAELTRYGFEVAETANLGESPKDESGQRETSMVIAKMDVDRSAAEYFSGLLQIPSVSPPLDIPQEKLGQLTIILGKDYVFTPLQDLVPMIDEDEADLPLTSSTASVSSEQAGSAANQSAGSSLSASSERGGNASASADSSTQEETGLSSSAPALGSFASSESSS